MTAILINSTLTSSTTLTNVNSKSCILFKCSYNTGYNTAAAATSASCTRIGRIIDSATAATAANNEELNILKILGSRPSNSRSSIRKDNCVFVTVSSKTRNNVTVLAINLNGARLKKGDKICVCCYE